MNYKKINANDLKTIVPNNSSVLFATIQSKEKEEYINLYNAYRSLFTEFVIKKLNLKKYDDEIKNSGLNFKSLDEAKMDVYQYFSSELLKYFYIRNNIYVEKLSQEERKFIESRIKSGKLELDEGAENMIKSTYKKVIFEDALKNGENCYVFYGPNSSNFSARNDSLIIGIRYDEYYLGNLTDEEWDKQHDNQLMFLSELLQRVESSRNEEKDISFSIFMYDDFSTKRREEEQPKREQEER